MKKLLNNLVLINLLPIFLIHLIFLLFWLIKNIEFVSNVSLVEMIIDITVVPIYLILINLWHSLKNEKKVILDNFILMLIGAFLGCGLSYLNWGISTNQLLNPDGETLDLLKLFLKLNFVFILVGSVVIQILVLLRRNIKKEASV